MKLSQIAAFGVGPVVSAFFGLITIPILAWAFSPADVGRLNILQIFISFGLLLYVLGLDQAYVREYFEVTDRSKLLKACFLPGIALLGATGLISTLFSKKLAFLMFGMPDSRLYIIALICVFVSFCSRFLSLILRMQGRGLAFSMGQIAPKVLMLVLVCIAALGGLGKEFLQLQLIFLCSTLVVSIIFLWSTSGQWLPSISAVIDIPLTRSVLKFGVPLIFSGMAYWGLAATSTLVLRSMSTFTEMGIYSVSMSFAGVATIFQSAFSVVWAPIVYSWVNQGRDMRRVDEVARQALAVVCLIVTGCGIFSWLIDYILPLTYSNVKYLMLCSAMQPLLYTLSEITCVGISITRRTMLSVWVTLISLLVNVTLSLLLVPGHGASGAVIANAVAYAVFFVARTEASALVWRQFPRRRLYLFVGSLMLLCITTVLFAHRLPFPFALVWLGILPLVLWCFRLEIGEIVSFCMIAGRRHLQGRS